jgi:hypothetical protein
VPCPVSLPVALWKVGVGGLGLMGYVEMAGSGIECADYRIHWDLDPGSRGGVVVVAGAAW